MAMIIAVLTLVLHISGKALALRRWMWLKHPAEGIQHPIHSLVTPEMFWSRCESGREQRNLNVNGKVVQFHETCLHKKDLLASTLKTNCHRIIAKTQAADLSDEMIIDGELDAFLEHSHCGFQKLKIAGQLFLVCHLSWSVRTQFC